MRHSCVGAVLYVDYGGDSYKSTDVKKTAQTTHTQISACKTGEVFIEWIDCINVNRYPPVILNYSYARRYLGGSWIKSVGELCIIFYNCMWIYSYVKTKS